MNLSPKIGALISKDPALLVQLTTTLGLEDLYDLIEVMAIDNYNDRVVERFNKAKQDRG